MQPFPVPNMVQGVSQQAAQARRPTQAEDQMDCLNHPVEGCTPRGGFDVIGKLTADDLTGYFNFPILRDRTERYQVFVGDGTIRIFNLLTGTEADVILEAGAAAYLAVDDAPENSFAYTTAEDITFIANKERIPLMDDATSDSRPEEALFYFKAGAYKSTYSISVTIDAVTYTWEYETPDNSLEANAAYIQTDAICYALYNAMVTDAVNSITDDLGFNIARIGSLIRLWREDGGTITVQSTGVTGSETVTAAGVTHVSRDFSVPNSKEIKQVSVYSIHSGSLYFKLASEDSSTQFDFIQQSGVLTHPGGGWATFDLSALAWVTPASGTIRGATYWLNGGPKYSSGTRYAAVSRAYKSGNATGNNQAGFTSGTGGTVPLKVAYASGAADLPFTIDTTDGQGNTQLLGFKELVPGFDKLPQGGFKDMIFRVAGDVESDADDYYVQYTSDQTSQGVWEECVAPGIPITLDPASMPHRLINNGPDSFTFGPTLWGNRIAGDTESAKDPSFIGRPIEDIAYDNARLSIMHQAGEAWSRVNNPYVFFPDTVQTKLATAPVDYILRSHKKIAILRRVVQTDAATFLWAEEQQFVVSTNDLPFEEKNVSIKPSTSFSINDRVAPLNVGNEVVFASGDDQDPWSQIISIPYEGGQPGAEVGLTDHVPNYVPKDVAWIIGSHQAKKMVVFSAETPDRLYLYEWRFQGRDRIQSAWNTWRLPAGSVILGAVLDRSTLYLAVQRSDGLWLLKTVIAPFQTDPGKTYLTRLDLRITEDQMTVDYLAGTDQTRFTLPYLVDSGTPYWIVTRTTAGEYVRGVKLTEASRDVSGGVTRIFVDGDWSTAEVYGGHQIESYRTEGTVYIRDEQTGYNHIKRLVLKEVVVSHSQAGAYRVEVLKPSGEIIRTYPFEGRVLGDAANVLGAVALDTGSHRAPINKINEEVRVRFVNDTFLPSPWQSLVWGYEASN